MPMPPRTRDPSPMTSATAPSPWPIQLRDLALDLRWSWRPEIRALFRSIDPDGRLTGGTDPWAILRLAPPARLDELEADPAFRERLRRLIAERDAYLADGGWYAETHDDAGGVEHRPLVAYFTAEVGLDEALPLYSGGLGVLSGDHLKAAGSLGVPLVGVSLLYSEGTSASSSTGRAGSVSTTRTTGSTCCRSRRSARPTAGRSASPSHCRAGR
ncbi:MAG: hypothetical protein C0498_09790 [Anaerolinea sp.]|nr:hypothetical protein [Anaerolinea sp.]